VSVAFAEVAAHTNFTLLDGASHPAKMVTTAAMLGHAGIGVCDTNSLAGVVRVHSHSAVGKCCGGRLLGLKARE
jgi:error-prone DNA polymerase